MFGLSNVQNALLRSRVHPFAIFVRGLPLAALLGCNSSMLGPGGSDASSDVTDDESGARIIASGQASPAALGVAGKNVYWLNLGTNASMGKLVAPWMNGQIMKCAITGCKDAPNALVSKLAEGSVDTPAGFATDGTDVYWNNGTFSPSGAPAGLAKCSVSGCALGSEVAGAGPAWQIALDGKNVYWTTHSAEVLTCPLSGCGSSPMALWSAGLAPAASGIAVDASDIYWSTAKGEVMKCALSGCNNTPTVLVGATAALAAANQIALDDGNVYVVDANPAGQGRVLGCAKSGCGNNPAELAIGLNAPRALVTDGVNVYWIERGADFANGQSVSGAGFVRRCAVGGCNNSPTTIASGLTAPTAIAVDGSNVYWAEWGTGSAEGRISAAPK